MNAFTLQIPRSYLAAVARFAAKDDIRYYLNGVLVEVHANIAYLVGTDGHTLAVARIARDGENMAGQGSAILPRELVEKIKAKGNHGLALVLSVGEDGQCTLNDCGTRTTSGAIDGKFPDWRRVIPRKVSGEAQFLQPDFLARCKKAAEDLGSKTGNFALGYNGNSAALVTYDEPGILSVIMPMRGSACEAAPEWVGEDSANLGRLTLAQAWDEFAGRDRVADIGEAQELAQAENARYSPEPERLAA